ncbi:tropomyosin-like [Uranotaenia lowii]|uniref:tropomyosin-like n=1 Tax=Uranotaenia lowii TaxID=190385 RepID=UPI002478E219|nr:tropomyosin-like [Uranotaenia lowii]
MDNQEFSFSKSEFDLENIRDRLVKCICELQSKRNEVSALKTELDECTRLKTIAEQDAKNYQREVSDLRDQLKITMDALNQKDAIRTGFMENAARQNVHLEAMTNERERFNEKLEASQAKIIELSRDNNKLQEQIKVLQNNWDQPAEKIDRIWKAMDNLHNTLENLETDQKTLTNMAKASDRLTEEAASALISSRNMLATLTDENCSLKRKILDLEAQVVSSKMEQSVSPCGLDDFSKKFEENIKLLTDQLEQERETSRKLKNDMTTMATLQKYLTEQLEQTARNESSELAPTIVDPDLPEPEPVPESSE